MVSCQSPMRDGASLRGDVWRSGVRSLNTFPRGASWRLWASSLTAVAARIRGVEHEMDGLTFVIVIWACFSGRPVCPRV